MTNQKQPAKATTLGCTPKRDVAGMYFPNLDEKAAVNALSRKIRMHKDLLTLLEEKTGYNKNAHSFEPKQIEILFQELGNPIVTSK